MYTYIYAHIERVCERVCASVLPMMTSSSFPSSSHSPSFRPYLSLPLSPVREIRSRGGRYIRVCEFMFECVCALVLPHTHTHTYTHSKHTFYPSSLSPVSLILFLVLNLVFSPSNISSVREKTSRSGRWIRACKSIFEYVRAPVHPISVIVVLPRLLLPFLCLDLFFHPLSSVRGIQLRDGR